MRYRFWLKLLGTSGFMWLFFIAYFHLLRHPVGNVTTMPLTALDHAIPFQPLLLVAYLSLWFYIGIVPGLMLRFSSLMVYVCWAAALCLAGLTCFYLWPTAVPALTVDVGRHPAFAMLQGVDAAGNACPSLHVATAVFTASWLAHLLRQMQAPRALRVVNVLWVVAIAYSTLAIKQHVLLDALAGAALGAAFAWISLRLTPRD